MRGVQLRQGPPDHQEDDRHRCHEGIEQELREGNRQVVLVSSVEPVHYLECGGGPLSVAPQPAEMLRWRAAMSHFATRSLAGNDTRGNWVELWDSLAIDERRVLANLAQDRAMHPKAARIAARLLGRDIIRRRPGGRIDFASVVFRQFVREAWPPVAAIRPPRSAYAGALPYAGILLVGGALLFLLQEESATRLIGLATSLAGGFETIRKQVLATIGTRDK